MSETKDHQHRPSATSDSTNQKPPTFGLPDVPEYIGYENSLENAPLTVFDMNGDAINGHFLELDQQENSVTILDAHDNNLRLFFLDLRFLIFTRPLLPVQKEGLSQSPHRPPEILEVIFIDGKKIHAYVEKVIETYSGFHMFIDKPNGHIYRIFVPRESVKCHSIKKQAGNIMKDYRQVKRYQDGEINATVIHDLLLASHFSIDEPHVANCQTDLSHILTNKWPLPKQHLGELLVARGLLTEERLNKALTAQRQHPRFQLGNLLIKMKILSDEEVLSTLALKLGIPFVHLPTFDLDPIVLSYLPQSVASKHHLLPLCTFNDHLIMATSDPTNYEAIKMAEFISEHRLELVVTTEEEINDAILKHYGHQKNNEDFAELESSRDSHEQFEESEVEETRKASIERPIVRLVQNILVEAVRQYASDIHIRPGEQTVELIYRVDGSLNPIRRFNRNILSAVISRIKILGNMDISEHRIPQDGRTKIVLNGKTVDLRISIMPTVNGESVVIRLLDTSIGVKDLDALGFNKRDYNVLSDIINRTCGMLLVTGPTGSGKSTTLYAALKKIRQNNVNIITAEDPVEYRIAGIEQMQVQSKVGYTFARILRNILRHDPDVIMVGEIRDQETAQVAIESALTGHLVLSTLHTNNAAVTVTRLLEMGLEAYLLKDTLLGVLAQRLVRKNCTHCLEEEQIEDYVIKALGITQSEKFYKGRGCDECNNTGYSGRMAVYELLTISDDMRHIITDKVSANDIHHQAMKDGMVPLTENALNIARDKKTSLSEVYRIRLS